MVSHFGEVTFPSSRAFWDDEDEYELAEDLERHAQLNVRWLEKKPERMEELIIMEGSPLTSFVEQCFCRKATKVCTVENESLKEVSAIYHVEKQIYLCLILPQFVVRDAGEFTNQISDVVRSTASIISIVCQHVSQFHGTNVPEVPSFLRVLTTKRTDGLADCNIPPLEQPNIVFGVGAGVLSYAKFLDMPAKLYVLYIDSFVLDSKCAEPILTILPTEMRRELQDPKCTKTFFSKGNLYI